jgi:serine/threonine-protein kinase RsbT
VIEHALPGARVRVPIRHESDVAVARGRTRELASRQGLSETETAALATAVTEIAMNILIHAGTGDILLLESRDAMRRGVIAVARDAGPGIAHVEQAMQDGFSTTESLGFGLPGAKRLADEFKIESQPGIGTTVTLWKWASTGSR